MILPKYQELTREQDTVLNLPLQGNYLITGPPGSGKTVLALLRAKQYMKQSRGETVLLTYNRLLHTYLNTIIEKEGLSSITKKFFSWIFSWYRSQFRSKLPRKEGATDPYDIDYGMIFNKILQVSESERKQCSNLLIDEGQDLPKEIYAVFQSITDNMTTFADENQRLSKNQSTVDDIRCMHFHPVKEYLLKENFRNTLEIAKVARSFYCGLPTGIPELPLKRRGNTPVVFNSTVARQVEHISRYSQNNKDKQIGVFLPTCRIQESWYTKLAKKVRENGLFIYNSNKKYKEISFDFTQPGIYVLTYQSAKGLEFDTVFIPNLTHGEWYCENDDRRKMEFYVLSSRARKELYFMYSGENMPDIVSLIDKNLYIKKTL